MNGKTCIKKDGTPTNKKFKKKSIIKFRSIMKLLKYRNYNYDIMTLFHEMANL